MVALKHTVLCETSEREMPPYSDLVCFLLFHSL